MVSSPRPSHGFGLQDAASGTVENQTHIHVIVCSCCSSALTKDFRFSEAHTPITSLPQLPHLQNLISNFIPCDTTSFNAHQQTSLQLLSRGSLRVQDLVCRSGKYIQNPLRVLGLANRARIYSSGLLNPRLWFNIAVVITWLVIRRTFEIFGINLPGFAATAQDQQVQQANQKQKEENIAYFQEQDFVHLEAPWVD